MRRYFKFLTTSLIACVLTIACVNELDLHQPINESEFYTTLVPRVEGFANQYITKSSYDDDDEQTITKLAILVFNGDGKCIHLQESENGGPITLNKSMLNSPEQSGKLDQATVVMIANIGTNKIVNGDKTIENNWRNLTFSDLENYSFQYDDDQTIITSLGDDFSGFPMIGGASNVNLTSTSTKQEQAAIEVKLKILYAKIKFAIEVTNGTENEGTGMEFELKKFSVFNASKETKLEVPQNIGEPVISFSEFLGLVQEGSSSSGNATQSTPTASSSYAYTTSGVTGMVTDNHNKATVGSTPITFTFYISESRFNHETDLSTFYPNGWTTTSQDEDVEGYTLMSQEERERPENRLNGVKYFYDGLIQQYKPLLAASTNGKPAQSLASYVLLNGSYTDYRGQLWNVDYKVYLGKDNAQNFQVDRNSCYTNNIVIKGIRNNDDTDGRGEVWIDHRVDVEIGDANSAADHITITRETLIDSHIEVRPLRVQWGTVNGKEEYDVVKLYLPTDGNKLVDWIGVELFVDGINNQDPWTYCYSNVTSSNPVSKSTGKRRYFTDGLIKELQNKEGEFGVQSDNVGKFIYLHNTQCAWIYFDENNTTSDRTANIKLHFYKPDGTYIEEIYQVKQEGLLSLGSYYVESYEEYLHSYDSEDKYNLSTSPVDYTQQGLSWGLEGDYISKDIVVSAGPRSSWILSQGSVDERYDYFHRQDQPSDDTYYLSTKNENGDWTDATAGTGLIFTDRASYNEVITVKDMGTIPDNAYQYCLSKNKFAVDEDDKVTMKVHWYLPDAYEMRAILNGSGNSSDFDTEANYWSSQPSYTLPVIQNIGFVGEVPESARAVSSSGEISDKPRKEKHRIRCIYSPTGVTANMDGRTPDGVGGNHTFVMKAYNGSSAGYFNYMLKDATSKESKIFDDFDYNNSTYPVPTIDNPGDFVYFTEVVAEDGSLVSGFREDPSSSSNWKVYDAILSSGTYYYELYDYPGLSEYNLDETVTATYPVDGAAKPLNGEYKEDKKIEGIEIRSSLDRTLSGTDLEELDYTKNGDMFKVSFGSNVNTDNTPIYTFEEISEGSYRSEIINRWRVPTYPPKSYTPKKEKKEEPFTETGRGVDNAARSKQNAYDNALAAAKEDAKDKALAAAKVKYPENLYDITIVKDDYGTPKTIRQGYFIVFYCEIEISCTLTVSIVPKSVEAVSYFGDAENYGWYKYSDKTDNLHKVETDELRIYSGNSFTISLSDKYKDSLEITKVKVHYSGSYQIEGGNTEYGDATYMRFILDDPEIISLPISETVEKEGWLSQPTETLYLPGMGYSDRKNGGWQEWSGKGRSSVPLTLVHYSVVNNTLHEWFDNSYTYTYDNPSTDFDKSIVIDKIEVKCTKKPEAGN